MEMTETGEIKLSSNHVVLPASIAIPAIMCYYHGGPRANEPVEKAPEEVSREEPVPERPLFPEGVEPKGYAKRMIEEAHDEEPSGTAEEQS